MIEDELLELESAEDFLEYFDISYEPEIVRVCRLHILQRFHDYLSEMDLSLTTNEGEIREQYKQFLHKAYDDFKHSNAATEKVFKVFRRQNSQEVFISVEDIGR